VARCNWAVGVAKAPNTRENDMISGSVTLTQPLGNNRQFTATSVADICIARLVSQSA